MKVLVVNCGSSSLKFRLFEAADNGFHCISGGVIRRIGADSVIHFQADGPRQFLKDQPVGNHTKAFKHVTDWLYELEGPSGSPVLSDIKAVGHRVVHGGSKFRSPVLINEDVITAMEGLSDLAPLHNPACISGIRAAESLFGNSIPMVAVFDTAFHCSIPEYASTYAIPYELSSKYSIKRYGFHGTAHRYMALRYSELTGRPLDNSKVITIQLGNGSSITAVLNGKSVDTSMGFTPLEGLVMGTRSGDIDPAIIGYLCRKEGLSTTDIETVLNEKSGMLGLTGYSNDIGAVLEYAESGQDKRCRLAVDIFCYRVRKYIGAYLAVLGGAEAIVFSGGVGENSPEMRRIICRDLAWSGLETDPDLNIKTVGREGRISSAGSTLHAYVIPVDEELIIARDTVDVLKNKPEFSGAYAALP